MSTSIPRPGQHLPGSHPGVDPARIHVEVDELLTRIRESGHAADPAAVIAGQAELFEQAHEVLVRALSTVDKI
ncbi:hypothetical protein [Rhodococcus chondri]|uniref:Uncharacterized protein n=1 Tax=Rhodococcus chondri TaxID=3065941 RepID=A0ABU7JXD0_9NOCA|nr:hypothetical protein [Rhodococcus sp. CC-R104]MEE2034569.1 hypothetical protein [Rhodococcus sp. CC-R104]